MELYYKPNNRGGAKIVVTDDMAEAMKTAQRAIAQMQGLLPVTGYTDRPPSSSFGGYIEKYLPVTDEYGGVVSYAHQWQFHASRIRLSQEKILTDEVVAPILPQLIEQFSGDEELVSWWTNDPVYVRGSALAARAMQILNLTEAQLEQVVLRCRG